MHVPAETLARQSMGKLVGCCHRQDHNPREQQALEPPESCEVVDDFVPFGYGDNGGARDEQSARQNEVRRKTESHPGKQPVEEPVGIEGLEPQPEQIAPVQLAP